MAPRRGELGREGADGEKDDRPAHRGQGEVERGARADPHLRGVTHPHDEQRARGKERGRPEGQSDEGLGRGAAAGDRTDGQEFPATGVLLSSGQLRAGQDPQDRADDGDNGEALPRRIPGDGADVVRRSDEGADPGVVSKLLDENMARRDGLIARGVGQGLGGDVQSNDHAPARSGARGLTSDKEGDNAARTLGPRRSRGRRGRTSELK